MTNEELLVRVAKAMVETPPEERMIYNEVGALVSIRRDLRPTARAVLSEAYEALQARYAELQKLPYPPSGSPDDIRKFLKECLIGEDDSRSDRLSTTNPHQ